MLAGALPDEMPRVLRIDTDWATTVSVRCMESSHRRFCQPALVIHNGVDVVSWGGRHKPDAEYASVRGIAESFHLPALGVVCGLKPTVKLGIRERIRGVRERHVCRDFQKVVSLERRSGLGDRNV